MQRVGHLVQLEQRVRQQLVGCRGRQRGILLRGEGAEAMPGLGRDDHPGTALGDDLPDLFQDDRRPVQVDGQDRRRRRLAG